MHRPSNFLVGLAVATVAGALGSFAALETAAASSPAGCKPAVAMTHIRGSEGAGQTGYLLTIKNAGSVSCVFNNQPAMTLLGRHGKALPTHVHWTGKARNITIGPGKAVHARLRFSPDVPGGGEPQKGRCEPLADNVRVDLTLRLKTLGRAMPVTGPVRPPTSVCEHGQMSASPLS